MRRLRPAAWALAALLCLSGCANLQGAADGGADGAGSPGAAPAAAAASPSPAPTSTTLDVVAPAPLQALLLRYLDLARVDTLANGEPIDDSEWSRLIDAAPSQVRELLQTEGYFAPKVIVTREPSDDDNQRRVRLELDPGPRTQVTRFTLQADGELGSLVDAGDPGAVQLLNQLRGNWPMGVGEPFRNPAWNDAKAATLTQLRTAGYANASWAGSVADINADKHEARLFLVADSGPLYRSGAIEIEGLKVQDVATVKILATFEPGTPVNEQLLLDYQERLQKTGLFDSVTVTLDPDPVNAARARILVRVREAPLQVWTFGLGISANTGPRASVEHVYRRVFGFPATARNKLEWGGLKQSWDGEISTHPQNSLYRYLVGGAVERLESDSDIVTSQRLRLGYTQDTLRIERLYYVETERSARETFGSPPVRSTTVANSVRYDGVWRNLDNAILPTDGYTMSIQLGLGRAHGTDSESGPFTRLYARLTGYKPLGRAWYGQARVEFGQMVKRDAVAVPESLLWRAGGDESVRGYSYRSLGPVVDGVVSGGTTLLTTSFELARPISARLPSVWGAVFVDVGGAANGVGALKPSLGTGVGVRWRSPVGPLRLDLAHGRDTGDVRLHFSVGIAF
ncbi:autotransporter assembly complex protein TamA [Rubrivivax sp. RP6-9]|uniref:autotransporter assembly complex protein TamA n=1 Tax=Rubrivivax sp. RP6-9 TaxID=3415750 RepID=UPI003CC6B3BD